MNENYEKTQIAAPEPERTQMVSNATQYAASVDCPVCKTPNPPSETYCTDCGFLLSAQPLEVEAAAIVSAGKLTSPDGLREFPLKPGVNTVGRENADVLLASNTVSRKHAQITVDGATAKVEDLGSTNGSYVDNKKLTASEIVDLTDGCEVMFGSERLVYAGQESAVGSRQSGVGSEVPSADEDAPNLSLFDEDDIPQDNIQSDESKSTDDSRLPTADKLVSKDGTLTFDLKSGVNTIGRRAGDNDIVIPDPYCSGRHADLLAENGAFTITDIGSTNGTFVNGVRLDADAPRQLQPGDELTLGRIIFTIEVA